MGRPNEYNSLTVTATDFGRLPDIKFEHICRAVLLINDSTSGTIYYSFNGVDIDGEMKSTDGEISYSNVQIGKIWFKTGGTSNAIRVMSWA